MVDVDVVVIVVTVAIAFVVVVVVVVCVNSLSLQVVLDVVIEMDFVAFGFNSIGLFVHLSQFLI